VAEESKSQSTSSRRSSRSSRSIDETNETQDTQSTPPELEHTGEVVDRLGKWSGEWADVATMQAVVAYARLCEEAEDIWAEAQNIRSIFWLPCSLRDLSHT
jgi:hypothetical protein